MASKLTVVYDLLHVETPLQMSQAYTEFDQQAFKAGRWDPDDMLFMCNRVKAILEQIGLVNLVGDEQDWAREILWFWHHHAISIMLQRGDVDRARVCSYWALHYQAPGHSNQVTRALDLFVHNKLTDLRRHLASVEDESERDIVGDLVKKLAQFGSVEAVCQEIRKGKE